MRATHDLESLIRVGDIVWLTEYRRAVTTLRVERCYRPGDPFAVIEFDGKKCFCEELHEDRTRTACRLYLPVSALRWIGRVEELAEGQR